MIQQKLAVELVVPTSIIPPLEPGDHLTRTEFERRFDAMPGLKKAELIEGVVYMSSPVRMKQHGQPHIIVSFWLGSYLTKTPFIYLGDNVSVRLDGDNMPQPDVAMLIASSKGGQATLSDDDYIEGAPELIVEVAASSVSLDLNTKFRIYRRDKVKEYVVWRVLDGAIDWFALKNGEYQRLAVDNDGMLRSLAFPGLWLDPAALVAFDFASVLDNVQRGLADPSHAAFVAKLQA